MDVDPPRGQRLCPECTALSLDGERVLAVMEQSLPGPDGGADWVGSLWVHDLEHRTTTAHPTLGLSVARVTPYR